MLNYAGAVMIILKWWTNVLHETISWNVIQLGCTDDVTDAETTWRGTQ